MPPASRRAATPPQGENRVVKKGGEGKKHRLRGRALTAQLEKDLHRMANARVKRRYFCPKFKASPVSSKQALYPQSKPCILKASPVSSKQALYPQSKPCIPKALYPQSEYPTKPWCLVLSTKPWCLQRPFNQILVSKELSGARDDSNNRKPHPQVEADHVALDAAWNARPSGEAGGRRRQRRCEISKLYTVDF
jgi:hypothetical protein